MTVSTKTSGAKVLFLLSSLSIGGSERKIVRLANALSLSGRTVVLAYLNPPETLLPDVAPSVKVVHLERRGKFSFAALRNLRDVVLGCEIDVVVSINLYATLYAGLLALGRRRLSHAVRFISSINATELRGRRVDKHMIVYRPLLRRMDLMIFGSEFQRSLWLKLHLGPQAPNTCVLYNGVDADHFCAGRVAPIRVPGWPRDRVVIGSVGVLRSVKCYEHLIEAVAILRGRGLDVGAVLVGEGETEAKLRSLVADLGVHDYVHFAGAHRDVRAYVAGFDIFAVTSSTETFSNAALEALALGRPVVSSAVGGMPEMLSDGGGVVYEYRDGASLAAALHPLVADGAGRAALASQAREIVLRRFSFPAMVQAFERLLDTDAATEPSSSSSALKRARFATLHDSSH